MRKISPLPTWQVFLLLIIPSFFPSETTAGIILTVVWVGFVAYCIYFLGESLYQALPAGHDLKIKRFYFNLLFPVVYMIIVFILFDGGYELNQDNYKEYGWVLAIIIPLHLFAMYCLFYTIWFIAKCIAIIENKKVVGFDNYATIEFGVIFRLSAWKMIRYDRVMIEFMPILCFAVVPLPIVYIVARWEFHIVLFALPMHYNRKFC